MPVGYTATGLVVGLYLAPSLSLIEHGLGPIESISLQIGLVLVILKQGLPLFLVATAIAEFNEIRAFGFYITMAIINSHLVGLILIFRGNGNYLDLYIIFNFLFSAFGILITLGGLLAGSFYWFVAGQHAKRSWKFGQPKQKPKITWDTDPWRLY